MQFIRERAKVVIWWSHVHHQALGHLSINMHIGDVITSSHQAAPLILAVRAMVSTKSRRSAPGPEPLLRREGLLRRDSRPFHP